MFAKMDYIILMFAGLLALSSGASIPISKCKVGDSACLKQSAQALVPILAVGIPEIGAKSLDPLHIPLIDASGSDVKLHTTKLVVTGMKGCTIPDASHIHDATKHTLSVDVLCDVDVQAQYDMVGKIIILPVDGHSHLSIQLYQILISWKANVKDVVRDGKTYWNVDDWDFSWILKDHADIELTDLFRGSPVITKAVKEIMDQSANEIIKLFGPPIVKAITTEVVDSIKHLFNSIPAEDLVLN
uniref:Odorant binding protein n=1 Tax=Glyphodes pyloalis TaxID=1242752 RepID=A0A6M3GUC2_GLYPY|nr:odorant binding protein [Glyphodes pyloalis]